ncbi:MAG: hypothetical protein RBQ97_00910 [Acholeplasma sp.]|nr:hypothetical protein [Acholeplasma sp.]
MINILLNIGNITIDWKTFSTFFIGVGVGFLLLLLIYLYAVLRGLNKELRLNKVQEEDIDEEEIKWLIAEAQKEFKDYDLRVKEGYGKLLSREIRELTVDIAKKFYPESPYPYLELTVDESIELVHYITNRVNQLLSSRILRLFRGMTIRKIVELNNTKVKIEESRLVKAAKKHRIPKVISSTMKVVNVVNPFYWFKKITIDKAIEIIMVKIGLSLIAITGEETYKIYSKKVFDKDVNIETNVEDLYNEIRSDIKDLEEEEEKNGK